MVALVLLLVAPLMAGCLKVHTTISVSDNDKVSGEITAAVKPRDDKDQGPQFDENMPFSQKLSVSSYKADGYVGSQASFSNLTFAELPQLAGLSRDANGVDISLRRAGNLVILEGRVDLTNLSDPDADVSFTASFPGEVTSTNGDRIDANSVEWKLKPGTVSTMSAQSRYTDPSTRSFRNAAIWLIMAAFLVSGLIGYLAWRDRDLSPRPTTADEGSVR
ncbi:MAG: LppM family (lipo)protein [Mycobacterium sp.]